MLVQPHAYSYQIRLGTSRQLMMFGNSSNQFAQNKGTMPPATKKLKLTLPPTKLCGSITTIPQTTILSHP